MSDLDRLEELEDRVIDLVLDFGGDARIWRTFDDDRPQRMVRGLIVNLFPGQDPLSLLFSPEGWLTALYEIEQAERGELSEPSWCFCKTQFGPVEGHVAVVELLSAIKQQFIPGLEVHDDSQYWEHRNLSDLRKNFAANRAAIDAVAQGLREFSLSPEAAEDVDIVAAHVERVVRLVHQRLTQPATPRVVPQDDFDPNDDGTAPTSDELRARDQAAWDEMYKYQQRRNAQIQRIIVERMSQGESHTEAFENALRQCAAKTSHARRRHGLRSHLPAALHAGGARPVGPLVQRTR